MDKNGQFSVGESIKGLVSPPQNLLKIEQSSDLCTAVETALCQQKKDRWLKWTFTICLIFWPCNSNVMLLWRNNSKQHWFSILSNVIWVYVHADKLLTVLKVLFGLQWTRKELLTTSLSCLLVDVLTQAFICTIKYSETNNHCSIYRTHNGDFSFTLTKAILKQWWGLYIKINNLNIHIKNIHWYLIHQWWPLKV